METPLKYDSKVCINELEFVNEESRTKFANDFDETYNVFLVKIGDLLTEYGVGRVDVVLSKHLGL